MKIIALIGKAGSGKDTLLHEIMAKYPDTFHEIVSCTSRPPREGEKEGVNYYFLTDKEFIDRVNDGDMLEHTNFNNWFYGTSFSSLSIKKINIGVFNPAGVTSIQENYPNIDLQVYYLRAPAKERLLRQLNREENPKVDEIIRRYSADEKDFADLSHLHYSELWNNKPEDIPSLASYIIGQNT